MKKINYIMCAIISLMFIFSLSAYAQQRVGTITNLKGTAQVFREEVPSPITVSIGIPVYLHDRVKTGDDSYLRIELIDGSILSMGKEADLSLDKFEFIPKQKKRSAFFRMTLGKLRFFARKMMRFKERDFKVGTPTAVVGVRGSMALVYVQSKTITKVVCLQDVIEVYNVLKPDEFVVLTENFGTDIIGDNAPTKPMRKTKDEIRSLQEDLEALTSIVGTTTTSTTTTTTTTPTTTSTTTTTTSTTTTTTPSSTTTTTTLPGPPEPPEG
jgi:hypothetical protein